eukprot:gnl/TRDRNA2_/TRDRNA2_52661_c0_seq1.p1 gnl/TRDRNA2_/TRDRNA2_52661_c0~~gnl/TRDRNA2_/TRDRNA2_52661_c0_seq1.p1  ORF type:complete len:297 (-),score=30.05 gnl/TRDRNA2_/TRDRNA2_52661_c0_seq1:276-1166(-)
MPFLLSRLSAMWKIRTENGGELDSEGLTEIPRGNLLISTEPGPLYALPPFPTWGAGTLQAVKLRPLPHHLRSGVKTNEALEALTVVPQTIFSNTGPRDVVGSAVEMDLIQDDPTTRRLLEMNATTGEVLREALYIIPVEAPVRGITEMLALDSLGLAGGGQFLVLERGWTPETGNDIRLYLADTDGATDVAHCPAIIDTGGASHHGDKCALHDLTPVKKELLLHWTPELPLAGSLRVDNYEGMAFVPPAAFGQQSLAELGGLMVLLINDNNDNPAQIGSQFVLLRLIFANTTSTEK